MRQTRPALENCPRFESEDPAMVIMIATATAENEVDPDMPGHVVRPEILGLILMIPTRPGNKMVLPINLPGNTQS